MQELEKIWMNGELVDWADAKVHVGTHGLHYGSGVFEGIRAYETAKGSAVFRLTDHLKRLDNSARLLNMELGYTLAELRTACMDLIGANGVRECRSEEHTSDSSHTVISYAVFCLKKKKNKTKTTRSTMIIDYLQH